MSRQSKKSKNELDIILEQLKKSYGSDSLDNNMLEDDLLESPKNEEDTELNEILGRLFSSDKDNESIEIDSENDSQSEDAVDMPDSYEENIEVVAEKSEQDDSTVNDTESVETIGLEDSDENDLGKQNTLPLENNDKIAVDNVLNIMFSGKTTQNNSEEIGNAIANIIDASPETLYSDLKFEEPTIIEDVEKESVITDSYNDLYDELIDAINTDEDDISDDHEDVSEIDEIDEIDIVADWETDDDDEAFAVEDEEYAISEKYDCASNEEDYTIEASSLPRLILSPSEYTSDPLQETLPTLSTNENLIAAYNRHQNNKAVDNTSKAEQKAKEDAFDSNDISLLLKFGYDDEIRSTVGDKKTQQVLLEADENFTPDSTRKVFGFCGKELTDRKQISKIQEKYKINTRNLVILLSIVSTISLLILCITFSFEFFSNKATSYPVFLSMEFSLIVIMATILYKKLVSGFNKLMKLETSPNTIFVFVSAIYVIYTIFSLLGFIICSEEIDPDDLMLFGFCVSIYAVLSLISDLLSCIKERKAFNIIASSDTLYTAEKQEAKNNGSDQEFRIRQTKLISGYFRKTSQNENLVIKPMYLIGIVPIVSIIVGVSVFFITKSLMLGLSLFMLTLLFCLPISCLFSSPLIHYVLSCCMVDKNTSYIGDFALNEMSRATTLIFRDSDSLEITGYTEIHPTGRTDTSESLKIAYEIFNALGGPLSVIGAKYIRADGDVSHEIVINQISDNGIDIYFDSSINVLLGDKQYMQSHNIKVKTDTNLSTATKGADRSVIFMAFDGIPKLGFIINSRIKPKFLKMCDSLHKSGIKVCVQTYEPQINNLYYEQNKGRSISSINVIKTEQYESVECLDMCDGCIVSSEGPTNIADAVSSSAKMTRRIKANKLINIATIVFGILLVCAFTVFVVQGSFELDLLAAIRSHLTSVFNTMMLASLIPVAVQIIHIVRNKKK